MAPVGDGVAGGEHRKRYHAGHGLDAQAAGDDKHVFGPLGNLELAEGLGLVAQKIDPYRAGDMLALRLRQGQKLAALRFFLAREFLEAFVAGDDEDVIRAGQGLPELLRLFEPVFCIVFQTFTFHHSEPLLICHNKFTTQAR